MFRRAYYQKDICVWDLGGLFLGGLFLGGLFLGGLFLGGIFFFFGGGGGLLSEFYGIYRVLQIFFLHVFLLLSVPYHPSSHPLDSQFHFNALIWLVLILLLLGVDKNLLESIGISSAQVCVSEVNL